MRDTVRELLDRTSRVNETQLNLTPMTSASVLELSIYVFKAVGWPVVRASLPGAALVYVGITFLFQIVIPGLFQTGDASSLARQGAEVLSFSAVGILLVLPMVLVGLSQITTRTTSMVWRYLETQDNADLSDPDAHLGRITKLTLRIALSASWVALTTVALMFLGAAFDDSPLEALSVIAGGLGVLGLVTSGIVAVIVLARQALAPVAMVVEGLQPKEAVRRSVSLLKAYGRGVTAGWDAILSLGFRCLIVGLILWGGFRFLFSLFPLDDLLGQVLGRSLLSEILIDFVNQLPAFFAVWFVLPYWGVSTALIYAERRTRLDGFDIEMLQRRLREKAGR